MLGKKDITSNKKKKKERKWKILYTTRENKRTQLVLLKNAGNSNDNVKK